MRFFRNIAWFAAAVYATIPCYWIVVHRRIARWRRSGTHSYVALVLFWGAFIILALSTTYPWRSAELYRASIWSWILAALSALGAMAIYRRIPQFGFRRFIGMHELRRRGQEKNPALIVSGMHAHVRHPIYVGHLLMLSAWSIAGGTQACCWLWIFGVASGAMMLFIEEAELVSRFGDEYREYRRQVPMMVPRSAKIFRLPSRS